jgi:hypothetical protein
MVVAVGYARGKIGRFAESLGFVCNNRFLDNGFVQGRISLSKYRETIKEKEGVQ